MEIIKSIYYNLKSGLSALGIFGEFLTILIFLFIVLPVVGILIISLKIINFFKLYILEFYHYSRKTYKATLSILDNFKIYRKRAFRIIEYLIESFLLNKKNYNPEKIEKTKYRLTVQTVNLFSSIIGSLLSFIAMFLAIVISILALTYLLIHFNVIPEKILFISQITFLNQMFLKIALLFITFLMIIIRIFRLKKKLKIELSIKDVFNYKSQFWQSEYIKKPEKSVIKNALKLNYRTLKKQVSKKSNKINNENSNNRQREISTREKMIHSTVIDILGETDESLEVINEFINNPNYKDYDKESISRITKKLKEENENNN